LVATDEEETCSGGVRLGQAISKKLPFLVMRKGIGVWLGQMGGETCLGGVG